MNMTSNNVLPNSTSPIVIAKSPMEMNQPNGSNLLNTPNANPLSPNTLAAAGMSLLPSGVMPMAAVPPFMPAVGAGAPAAIYCGELHPEVTESMLYEMFSPYGPVASIRVCRDAVTRRSLGYAYINFHNMQDGERAMEMLNYVPMKGRPIRLMWSQRDPSVRRSGTGNIFIKNLDKSIDNKALHDTFSAFGNILSCKVVMDESGSKGYGYVHFEREEAAKLAIEKVNGMMLNDKRVFVGPHISRRERESKSEEMKARFTNVFIKNLPESVDDQKFLELFSQFGKITKGLVQVDENGKSKGFGFINFETHDAAQKAVDAMNNKEIDGRAIYVGRAQKKQEREDELRRQFEQLKLERQTKYQGINLYVKNIDPSFDDEKLKNEFVPFGSITSCKIMTDDKGISKGFGFVCFSTQEEAQRALGEMNGRMVGAKPIYVAQAQRKEIRRNQLEAQHAQRAQIRLQQQMAAQAAGMFAPGMYPGAPMFMNNAPVLPGQMRQPFFQGNVSNNQNGNQKPKWNNPVRNQSPQNNNQNNNQNRNKNNNQRQRQPNVPVRGPANNQGQQRRGFKYSGNVRNPPVQNRQDFPALGMMPTAVPAASGLTAAALAAAPPEQQKQILGENLYPLILQREPDLAAKITGMLLEMDNSELLHLLETPESLTAKVLEAAVLLREAGAN